MMIGIAAAIVFAAPVTEDVERGLSHDVGPPAEEQASSDHHWATLAFGSGPHSPMAFAGVELLVQPSRYFAVGVAVGFGPSVSNPDHRICLWSCDESAIVHAGPTPWRLSSSVLGFVPLGERADLQMRLALMRNPGAVYGFLDASYGDEYDEYDDDYGYQEDEGDSRIEYRPMALAVLATVGLKIRLKGRIFLRVEGGWSQVAYESVPWGAEKPYFDDELPEVVTRQYSPNGPSFMLSLGADLF